MRGYAEEEFNALITIDMCELFFWTQHHHVPDSVLQENEQTRQKAVTTLKKTFNYTDEMIRQEIKAIELILQEMDNNLVPTKKPSTFKVKNNED